VEREEERDQKPQPQRGEIEVGLESLVNQYGIDAVINSLNQLPNVHKKV
jgi:hypothetical protein